MGSAVSQLYDRHGSRAATQQSRCQCRLRRSTHPKRLVSFGPDAVVPGRTAERLLLTQSGSIMIEAPASASRPCPSFKSVITTPKADIGANVDCATDVPDAVQLS